MVNTNRINGLIYLKNHGMPIPDFLKVDDIAMVEATFFANSAPYGWTIRTCKRDGKNEISLFYKNNLSLEDLKNLIRERLANFRDEYYIVYPSWDFNFSFNVLKTSYEYIIEGKSGSQKDISTGKINPGFRIYINAFTLKINEPKNQILSNTIKKGVMRAIMLLKKNIYLSTYYTEVAITKKNEIFFYEFWNMENLYSI